jgi:PBP1b-binding outer membrane lipoprotein LpoB
MKLKSLVYFLAVILIIASCSKDSEVKKKGNDADVTHTGDKWTITSVDYTLIDQSTSGQTFKSGTKANAGSFYFDGENGSFEFDVENYHKEDVFHFTNDSGSLTVVDVDQNVGVVTNQNVLVLSGEQTSETERTLDGTITKQSSVASQFVLTATFTLVKD